MVKYHISWGNSQVVRRGLIKIFCLLIKGVQQSFQNINAEDWESRRVGSNPTCSTKSQDKGSNPLMYNESFLIKKTNSYLFWYAFSSIGRTLRYLYEAVE